MRLIRAAGGVVWRPADSVARPGRAGAVEIAVVHRDRYDDWSLPKGKLEKGEHALAAAVREVREEIGVTGVPQVRLPSTHYLTGEPDAEKTVDFWSMREHEATTFVSNHEVDELRWLAPTEAAHLLTYAHDRGVVAAFTALPMVTGIAILVRHASAGSRTDWAAVPANGPDDHRPLDETGVAQAKELAPLLSLIRPERVYSAPLTRCVDTVAPVGLPVVPDALFSEIFAAPAESVADRIRSLVAEHERVAISSQGGVIPGAVAALQAARANALQTFRTPKGTGWLLSFAGRDLIAADPLVP